MWLITLIGLRAAYLAEGTRPLFKGPASIHQKLSAAERRRFIGSVIIRPQDAIILIPHVYTVRSKLFHGRLNYVSKGGKIYADHLPGYDQRIGALHRFYDSETTIEEYLDLLGSMQDQLPGRAFYAVVMDPELSREAMAQRGAQLVFEKPPYGAHVYLLNPPVAS